MTYKGTVLRQGENQQSFTAKGKKNKSPGKDVLVMAADNCKPSCSVWQCQLKMFNLSTEKIVFWLQSHQVTERMLKAMRQNLWWWKSSCIRSSHCISQPYQGCRQHKTVVRFFFIKGVTFPCKRKFLSACRSSGVELSVPSNSVNNCSEAKLQHSQAQLP